MDRHLPLSATVAQYPLRIVGLPVLCWTQLFFGKKQTMQRRRRGRRTTLISFRVWGISSSSPVRERKRMWKSIGRHCRRCEMLFFGPWGSGTEWEARTRFVCHVLLRQTTINLRHFWQNDILFCPSAVTVGHWPRQDMAATVDHL